MFFDIPVLDFIQSSIKNPFLDTFMSTFTHLGDAGIFWILMTLAFLIYPKTRKTGLCCALALILDLLLCNVCIKPLVARTRPYDLPEFLLKDIEMLIKTPSDYSFPSGHTAASFAIIGALMMCRSKWFVPSLIIGILIAFSRLYLYVHFPTDVLAGLVVGLICGISGYFIAKKIKLFDPKPEEIQV